MKKMASKCDKDEMEDVEEAVDRETEDTAEEETKEPDPVVFYICFSFVFVKVPSN